MTHLRALLLACLVAFATGVAWAESDQSPRFEDRTVPQREVAPPASTPLPGRPASRFSREGYAPQGGAMPRRDLPERTMPQRDPRMDRIGPMQSYDARDRRIESLRNRYAMPSEPAIRSMPVRPGRVSARG